MVGIISNTAALFAQRNLESASTQSQSSIARLSSGNSIVKASDDVAGLAIGTTLATTVSSLRTVLSSTAQAGSLLSIADGGLQNISDILQRQKSLAVQANTGSLSNNERAFLDQEFQNLVLEIDRLVTNTNFNGVNLLDGAISSAANLTTATGATTETYSLNNTTDFVGSGSIPTLGNLDETVGNGSGIAAVNSVLTEATVGVGSSTITAGTIQGGTGASSVTTFTGIGVNSESVAINGVTFTFATNGAGASITDIGLGASATEAATNLVNAINSVAGQAALDGGTVTNVGITAANVGGVVTLTTTTALTGGAFSKAALDATTITTGGLTNGAITSTFAANAAAVEADTLDINGTVFTFATAGTASTGTTIEVGGTNAETLTNIVAHLNDTTANGGQGGGRAATVGLFEFSATATALTATSKITGVASDSDVINLIQNSGGDVVSTDVNITGGAVEVLNANSATTFDPTLQGALTNLTAEYVAGSVGVADNFTANSVKFTVEVGGKTYESDAFALGGGAVTNGVGTGTGTSGLGQVFDDGISTTIRFFQVGQGAAASEEVGFTLAVDPAQTTNITDQATAATLATAIQSELDTANVTINQSRELVSFDATATVGTSLQGLADANVLLESDAYTTTGTIGSIGAFTVSRSANTITTTIDDILYTVDLTNSDTTAANDDVTYSTANKTIATDGVLVFSTASSTDGRQLKIDLNAITLAATIDINSDAGETALATALNSAFGTSGGQGGLTFQVGTTSTDSISLTLSSAATTSIYKDDAGTAQTLAVTTAAGAITASDVLDNAINTITSLRSTVGGLQSRFDFAAANIQSSIQNTEAARANFLDTDVAAESTSFATAQVRLQASISVLAQANQLPQNLLKLIG